MDLANLLKTQISLTEWLENAGHRDAARMRDEDKDKRKRMAALAEIIDFPFDRPTNFKANDVKDMTSEVEEFIRDHKHELCALRLEPIDPRLPKFRMRGKRVIDVVETWFKEQNIDHAKYEASFVPHPSDHLWSTIIMVNQHGIFGEIIAESHEKLTQGFYEDIKPIVFYFDFTNWYMSEPDEDAKNELKKIISHIHVPRPDIQARLEDKLGARFSHNYLCGYFETTTSTEFGLWFIDYNRILLEAYDAYIPTVFARAEDDSLSKNVQHASLLKGQIGNKGKAIGKVTVVNEEHLAAVAFAQGDILVCDMTSPAYVPLMKKAVGVVTDRGGILTHAAIVSRELGIPCIVATKNATEILKNGQMIELDADTGTIRLIS